jgi:alkylated DNA repair dioxygenase AlkB
VRRALSFASSRVGAVNIEGVELRREHFPRSECKLLFEALREEIDWQREEIRLFGKTLLAPRLSAYVGDPCARYRYSGVVREPTSWSPVLSSLRDSLSRLAGVEFNSVLCLLYRDGNDSMGLHSDDERDLEPGVPICSVSFGATRTMQWRSKDGTRRERVDLADGDVLIVQSWIQSAWKHGISKTRRPVGERINLTFRRMVID